MENLIPDCVGRYITSSVGTVQLSNLINCKTYTKCWQAFVFWIASQCHLELSCNLAPIGVIQFQHVQKPLQRAGAAASAAGASSPAIPVFRFFQPFLDQFNLEQENSQLPTLTSNDVSAQRMNLITLSKMADCDPQTFRTALTHLLRRLGEALSTQPLCQFDLGIAVLTGSHRKVAFTFYEQHQYDQLASAFPAARGVQTPEATSSTLSSQAIKSLRAKYPVSPRKADPGPLPNILAKTLTLPSLPTARSTQPTALAKDQTAPVPRLTLLTSPEASYSASTTEDALPNVTSAVFQRKLRGRAPLDTIRQELERQQQLQGGRPMTPSGLLPRLGASTEHSIPQLQYHQPGSARSHGEMTQRIVSSALEKFIKASPELISPEDAKTTLSSELTSSLVISSPDELLRAKNALLAANLPPVLDTFAHTRAATFSDDVKSTPLSARIASYYTPEATAWRIDPHSQRLLRASNSAVVVSIPRRRYTPAQLEKLIHSRWIESAATSTVLAGVPLAPELVREAAIAFARQKQQYADPESYVDVEERDFAGVTVDDIAEGLRQRVKSLIRYYHYVTTHMNDAVVAPIKEEWIRHALQLLSFKLSTSLPFDVAERLIRNLLEEIKSEYIMSVKQAILDYVLLNPFQRARLAIPYPPPSATAGQPWGHASLLRQAPRSWRANWQLALAIHEHSLYVNSPVMLQLLEVWTKYSDILLVDLPSPDEPPITLIQFEQRQAKHLHKVQRIFSTQWTGECEAILKQYVKRHSLTDSNGAKFFDAVAALMSLQLRTIVYRSAVAYHAFFKQYVSAPSLQFNNSSSSAMPSITSISNPLWIQRSKADSERIWNAVQAAASHIKAQMEENAQKPPSEQSPLDLSKAIEAAELYESMTSDELRSRLTNTPRPVFIQSLVLHPSNKNESSAINFDLPLHDMEKVVVRVFDNMTHALKEIPRVENLIFPLLDDNRLLSVHIRNERGESSPGRHIEMLRSEIVQLFSRTVREAAALRELYETYASVFDYKDRLQQWLNAPAHQGRSLSDFKVEIMKHRQTADEIFSKAPSLVRTVMMVIDCSQVNTEIVQQSKRHADAVIARVAEITASSAENVLKECQQIKMVLDKELRSELELRDREMKLSEYEHVKLPEIRQQYQECHKRLLFLVSMGHPEIKHYCERVARTHKEVVELPLTISNAQNKTQSVRTNMEQRLAEEIARFQQSLQDLNREVLSLHTWTNRLDAVVYNNKLKELGQKLDDHQRDASVLQEKESLLTLPQADFSLLAQVRARLVPYQQLWSLYVEHDNKRKLWMYHSVLRLKAEEVEQQLEAMLATATQLTTTLSEMQPASVTHAPGVSSMPTLGRRGSVSGGAVHPYPSPPSMLDTPSSIAEQLRKDLTAFKAHLPVLHVMCNRGMLDRHWEEVESITGRNIRPSETVSLGKALEGLTDQMKHQLIEISEAATKQHAISEALQSMREAWSKVTFVMQKHKEGGSWILQTDSVEEVIAMLDDHLVKTQTIKGSSFAKPSEKELNIWENWLINTHRTIETWAKVQADWLYLEPVFESDDIMSQMPEEGATFKDVDLRWRALMQEVYRKQYVNDVMRIPGLSESVREWAAHLEMIHAGLKSYLENKREAFPRFYFLSNEELLEIVSETQDPTRVQRHLKKCFEGVNRLEFRENLDITGMQSAQGEEVELASVVSPSEHKNLVEAWLGAFEKTMRETILDQMGKAHVAHSQVPRSEWLTEWPAQVILAINQVYWTHNVTMALAGGRSGDQTPQQALRELLSRQNQELQQVVQRVRGDLSDNFRITLGALLMMDVHNRDIVQELMTKQVSDPMSFDWTSQLRYYYTPKGGLKVAMITTELNYGYEYLGNTERLVITSLTDRCYRTLMMALKLNLGGAPEGPAGTGKTETTKDLAKACGMHCVVFNCNDMLNFHEMAQFFKGIGTTGAWICFDEFNRLQLEVLSVVAQQILAVQSAKDRLADVFIMEDKAYPLARSAAVFVTMNPGYAGRSELPDNLKALFRPVAMMVPDYSLIAQMSLFSYGFSEADTLAKKIVTTYKLCSEQLSSQDHYDYGMRAVKAVLSTARRLKRMMHDAPEDFLVYRAIVDTNQPKFLAHDLPLFDGIVRDIFPGLSAPDTAGALRAAILTTAQDLNLRPNEAFVTKVVQLYETTLIRHGLMLVGLPFTGKTSAWRVLQATLNKLARTPLGASILGDVSGVEVTTISPKAVLPSQLYGAFSAATHEWTDGVLSAKFKLLTNSADSMKMWLLLDGPVDAMWIEDMNTVLDDSKKLCLANRQIIPLHPNMTVMFEVRDLAVASPATVSRCGMIYLEQNAESWRPIFQAWLSGLPLAPDVASSLEALADWLIPPILRVVYNECSQYSPQVQTNLVVSLMRLFDSLMGPLYQKIRNPAAAAAEEQQRRKRQEQLESQGLDQRLLRRRSSLATGTNLLVRRDSTSSMIAAAAAAGAAAAVAAANYNALSAVHPSDPRGTRASMGDIAAAAVAASAAAAGATESPTALSLDDDPNLIARIEGSFLFALVWSAGGVVDEASRGKFSYFLRELLRESSDYKLTVSFPKKGTVFDVLFDVDSAKWVAWSDFLEMSTGLSGARFAMSPQANSSAFVGATGFVIPKDAKFHEIIVPTVDSVRNYELINLFLANKHPLLFVGPTGTGKSVCITDMLINRMSKEMYTPLIINFSAQTSVNQTQNMIDAKLERRRRGVFGPAPAGKSLVIFCDDLNMPKPDQYGVQAPSELLRQYFDYNGWYDLHDHSFRRLVDIQFLAAMGPPGGGRNPMSDRFLRHWSQISVTPFDDESLTAIFSKILDWHWSTNKFSDIVAAMTPRIVAATKSLYSMVTTKLLPTPGRDHYTFNLRDFSRVIQGVLLSKPVDSDDPDVIARLWLHEVLRIFGDRMISDTDLTQVLNWAKDAMEKKLDVDVSAIFDHLSPRTGASAASTVSSAPSGGINSIIGQTSASAGVVAPHITVDTVRSLVFGHYASRRGPKYYSEIHDPDTLIPIWQHYLDGYNALSPKPMRLVMFKYAVEHLSRIARILKMPGGHALLVGVGGSGKRSLTTLAAYAMDLEVFTVEITKTYNIDAWKADLKSLLRKTGGAGKRVVFLLSDTQLKEETFLEDINSLLNIGEVPNLWGPEEIGELTGLIQTDPAAQKKAPDGTPAQLMSIFTERVKENLHIVLCMSPVGDGFRDALRKFPSLGNCCTIDWYRVWPPEALLSVSRAFLTDVRMESDEVREACAQLCLKFHMDARRLSEAYLQQQNRHVYVTPTSYLELITTFQQLLEEKRSKLQADRNRYIVGLEKLDSTEQKIHLMRQQLAEMQPALAKARAECEKMLETVNAETEAAMELRKNIAVKEASAQQAAALAKSIELECTRELEKAQPTLDAATEPLEHVTAAEIAELRTTKAPNKSLRAVMECLCYLRGIPPERVLDPQTGRLVPDFWPAAKRRLLTDTGLLKWMQTMDKDNIPDKVIQKLQQYRNSPELSIQALRQTSTAVLSMGLWIIAILDYDAVAKSIRPKREALARARENSEKAEAELQRECQILAETDARLAALRRQLEGFQRERDEVEQKIRIADTKIERAQVLIAGLGGQRGTWNAMSEELAVRLRDLLGDVLISSGFIAYLGGYTQSYREATIMQWIQHCHSLGISTSPRFVFHKVLGEPLAIRNWIIAGLPNDSFSIDNAVMVRTSRRWPLMIDPQGQANNWIRRMEEQNGLVVLKLTDAGFHRQLEMAIRRGDPVLLEDVGTEIDSALRPLLMREVVRKAGQWIMRFGDQEIEYSERFRLYITTSLRNPHFLPEIGTQVALINFMITPDGLQDQLLATVVSQERPHLEHERSQLIVKMHHNQAKLKENEDKILDVLRDSKGDILDDEHAVEVLTESRRISQEIEIKESEAAITEKEIESTRSGYRPVAVHGQILFFCVSQLANIDSMYQFSLPWYVDVFKRAITSSPTSSDRIQRINYICDTLTSLLYNIVCRSLFERHKLSFAASIAVNLALQRSRTLASPPALTPSSGQPKSRQDAGSNEADIVEDADNDESADPPSGGVEDRKSAGRRSIVGAPPVAGQGEGLQLKVTPQIWSFVLKGSLSVHVPSSHPTSGATGPATNATQPVNTPLLQGPAWMSERAWFEICALAVIPEFADLDKSFLSPDFGPAWRAVYEAADPHTARLPGEWQNKIDPFGRLALLRAIRPDKLLAATREFVESSLGPRYVQSQPFDLAAAFAETRPDTPILFILSEGSDPLASFMTYVREERMTDRCQSISLGQGQGPIATMAIQRACRIGGWVLLQNCHLAASWLPDLERICREIAAVTETKQVHNEFRLVLTSYPTPEFPVSILERSIKLVQQPPIGLKSNLVACYNAEPLNSDKWYESCDRRAELKALSFALSFFHCLIQERRGFGSLGWNIPYGFNNTDLMISLRQLHMFLNDTHRNTEVPLNALMYLTAQCNYGGRVTDDWDRRTLTTLLSRFYSPEVLTVARCPLSDSGLYTLPPPDSSAAGCLEHIERFPAIAAPEVFGLHENAEITRNLRDSQALIDALVASTHSSAHGLGAFTADNSAAAAQLRRTNTLIEHASSVLARLPPLFEIEKIQTKYPIRYEDSMNAVLIQECSRFNKLLSVITRTLHSLLKSLKGEIVTSSEMDQLGSQIYDGKVPEQWLQVCYPTKKPFSSFVNDLILRLNFLNSWIANGQPTITWFSGLYFPQSFLTACLQNYVRRQRLAIDTVGFSFEFLEPDAVSDRTPKPDDGAYISGLFFDGAAWSWTHRALVDAAPRVMYSPAPVIWIRPKLNSEISHAGRYMCPLYRTSDRRGTLTTTGHSTNFIIAVAVPTLEPEEKWIRRGVALLSQLDD